MKTNRTASVLIRGHAFIQNLRRGHYEFAVDIAPLFWLATAFDVLAPLACSRLSNWRHPRVAALEPRCCTVTEFLEVAAGDNKVD